MHDTIRERIRGAVAKGTKGIAEDGSTGIGRPFPDELKTERAIIRRMTLDDAPGWKRFNNRIAKRMPSWPIVPSVVYARNEILHYQAMAARGKRHAYTIIERSSGETVGDFHLKAIDRRRKRAEFGHALDPRVWGTGLTYEVLDAFKRAASGAGYSLWCKIEEENVRSWRSMEKYGARLISCRTIRLDGKRKRMRFFGLR